MGGKKWATRFALAAAFAYAAAKVAGRWRKADLRGEVAVIVGGSRGLGLMIARELAAAGCRLVIGARDVDQLRVAQRDLEARGAEVLIWPCDVGNRRDIDLLVAEAGERFGRIDILVNVAGLIQVGPAESMTIDNFRDAFAVNFWGPLHAMDAVIAQMQERGHGRIVNITSIGGELPVPHLLPYVAAKAGLAGLTRNAAHAHRWDRIRINGVNIGWTDTEGEDAIQRAFHGAGDDWREQAAKTQPMGKLGQVDEIAEFVVFLLSDRSGVVTGSVIDWDQIVFGGLD